VDHEAPHKRWKFRRNCRRATFLRKLHKILSFWGLRSHSCTNGWDMVWWSLAGKVTAGLAESNSSLPPGGWLIVTCELTACTPGSAPGPTLGNEYRKHLPFDLIFNKCSLTLCERRLVSNRGLDTTIDHFVWLSHKHATVFLPTSLHQLLYRLSRDNLKHFYLPSLSHHFKLLSHICVPCPRSYFT